MDLFHLSRCIEERYRRYLLTTFSFKDADLRKSFAEVLESEGLSRGPYLEATPVFKRTSRTENLFTDLLKRRPDKGFLAAVQGDRPLYQHQEEAIRKVAEGRNVIVATGTGSGKTEAFLYPILLQLYQEFLAGTLCPGVHALILYPMNALAYDQRVRLGEICERLKQRNSPFSFTFGQYVGETPEDERDSKRNVQQHIKNRLPGELVLRREMRQEPPHILLTNYCMLEYLLIRPDDSPLFDDGRARWWTFLVLDEAHQYRGSRGIEMAMLLRRLKQRLREGGREGPFRCIATSATLVGGANDKERVAQFAAELFDEDFRPEDVILGETEAILETGPAELSIEEYRLFRRTIDGKEAFDKARLGEIAERVRCEALETEDILKAIGSVLLHDHRVGRLRRLLKESPDSVENIAKEIFPELSEEQQVPALSDFVALLVRAQSPSSGAPILSARYHLFLRSLEGAFVSYWPEKKVFLNRQAGDEKCKAFEVALCRECGQHYLVGRIQDNRFVEAIRDPAHDKFGVDFLRPIENGVDEEVEDEDERGTERDEYILCLQCGEVRKVPKRLTCGHNRHVRVVKEKPADEEDRRDQMARCGACGYNAAGRDPVREVIHGADGPNAVIATTLHKNLDEERRKVLAFADGRQEAAFFAWYLEDTYRSIQTRNLILKMVRSYEPCPKEGLSLRDLANKAFSSYRAAFQEREAESELETRRNIWRALYREFLTDEQRICLEGVGLVRWSIAWPQRFRVPSIFLQEPWLLNEEDARDLVFLLLDTMRADRAVEIRTPDNVALAWEDLELRATQTRMSVGERGKRKRFISWDRGRGKRGRLLARILMRRGVGEDKAVEAAGDALRAVWQSLTDCDQGARSPLLVHVEDARRLNPEWWRLQPIMKDDVVFQCETCGRFQAVGVRGICRRHRCQGNLTAVHSCNLEADHYRRLYEENLPDSLRVEEHTAQLDYEKAREFQRGFKNGRIHFLSCSTTFELGVDLGDLDTVFLRNVPPEVFNYAQRVGRAGRRSGYPGFAVTYCKRGPHDLYHFAAPERILNGKVRPPVVRVQNEKIITRHITAVALSAFFRAFPSRFKNVESLIKNWDKPSASADVKEFLYGNRAELEETLGRVITSEKTTREVGLQSGAWVERVSGPESRLSLAEAEVCSDFRNAKKFERESRTKGDYRTAEWAKNRTKTIACEDVLSFLSRKAVIPKYGFPVDVVELDTQKTQEGSDVSLERDLSLAISEFAPTANLVANKKQWMSYALKKVPERELERKQYRRCQQHNILVRSEPGQPPPDLPCKCRGRGRGLRSYVVPQFGFLTKRDKPSAPTSRPARVFTTRPYFVHLCDQVDPGTIGIPSRSPVVTLTKASPGLMVVLCEGRRGCGFYICKKCGAGFRNRKPNHENPYGVGCNGRLEGVSLGHEFVTDVLQIQFHHGYDDGKRIARLWFTYSLAYALLEGAAQVMEVPPGDLNATVGSCVDADPMPPIVLYDNVPGGAGLVASLEEESVLRECLNLARERVAGGCGCDESTSCYGCLRSYRNQFAHRELQRGPVLKYLDALLARWG